MNLIDGRKTAKKIEDDLRKKLGAFSRPPGLAFVLVGSHPASKTYVAMKKKKCREIGIASIDKEFPETATENEVIVHIEKLNADPHVDGILVQLPLPGQISAQKVMERISPEKDVDGFHPVNMGRLLLGETNGFFPCTPHGIHMLLSAYKIPIEGKHVVILGRSNIVGKPLAAILMQKREGCNATVTIAHSLTKNLKEIAKSADILIAAMGHARFVSKEMVKPGAAVIDVGINRAGGKIVGDVDFENVAPLCSYITPVPGGVGPMTIAMLMSNTVLSYQKRC
jgi:methylenetetrahydrofolate dehydrogenase (NADP+)/methenyltetrahydrofolate cyclohydrolase